MNIVKVLAKYFEECQWNCGETYDSLEWYDKSEKPTQDELEKLWNDLLKDEMREERNQLLKESDFRVLVDYVKDKELWITYRQQLRDLPETWTTGDEFPIPP